MNSGKNLPKDGPPHEISISEKVAFLSDPDNHGQPAGGVIARQTHMSWVFLAGDRVYKLKKPITAPFLDFSTIEARKDNCRNEIRLNQSLAAGIYLGLAPLTREHSGQLAIDGAGTPVEWLVVMRRLPDERMLDRTIADGTATPDEIAAVANLLIGFYRKAAPAGISPQDHLGIFRQGMAENRAVLTHPLFQAQLAAAGIETRPIVGDLDRFLAQDSGLLSQRFTEGRIVEVHGDLRPEHICLIDPPVIFDRLEFSRILRLLDPFDELSYLSLECESLGAPWIGATLMRQCAARLGNPPPQRLLDFYTAYRACLRARLALRHLLEPKPREPKKWMPRAIRYLRIAAKADLRLYPREGP